MNVNPVVVPVAVASAVPDHEKWVRPNASVSLFLVHFKTLFRKRFQYAKRDRQAVCCNIITPSVVFMIGLIILKTSGFTDNQPNYPMRDDWATYNEGGETPIPYNTIYAGDGEVSSLFSKIPSFAPKGVPKPFDLGCGSAARACSSTFNITDSRGAGPNGDYVYNDPNFVVEDEVYEETVYFRSAPYEGGDPSLTD